MKATQRIVALGLSAALGMDALGAGVHVLPPSPPRCTADGACYPKHNTWGYYGQRWRTWPGVELAVPAAAAPETSVLGEQGYETPKPEEEERQAPPPLETTKPAEEEGAEGAQPPADTPPLNLPPLPFPTPQPGAPQPGTQDNDQTPPPPLPFQPMPPTTPVPAPTLRPLPGTQPLPAPGIPGRPTEVPLSPPPGAALPQRNRAGAATANEQDAPPAMPLHLTQRTSTMPSSSVQMGTKPRRLPNVATTRFDSGLMPAGAALSPSAKPRALPAIYTPPDDRPPVLPAFGK